MRIRKVTEEAIIFDNGNKITYDHNPDCCEWNYADFSILTPNTINYNHDFDEDLQFKSVKGAGFKFGSCGHWIFSVQNGYYSDDIDIYYPNEDHVLNFHAKFIER